MNEKIAQLERELNDLKAWKKSLEASHSIPLQIDQSFRKRFFSEQQFVDGGDGGSVNVSVYNSFNVDVPVVSGKRKVVIDGVEYKFLYQN